MQRYYCMDNYTNLLRINNVKLKDLYSKKKLLYFQNNAHCVKLVQKIQF